MKNITKVSLIVALIAILILSIVVATLAWFTSNPNVDANDVTLNAATTLTVAFDSELEGTDYAYDGQTGRAASGDNAPYVYEAGNFRAVITPSAEGKGGRIRIEFGRVLITTYGGGTIPNVLLTELFHVQANCYTESNSGTYVKDANGVFSLDDGTHTAEQHYALTGYEIADDGYVMQSGGASYAYFPQGRYWFSFKYTFLPETAYQQWSLGNYSSVYGYEFNALGDYVGLVNYVPYAEKYHSGLTRYGALDGEGHAAESASGGYVRAISSYALLSSLTRYAKDGDVYTVSASGAYVKIGSSNDYIALSSLSRYNRIEGFPYSHPRYMDAKYTFNVTCYVEEVEEA